MLGTGLSLDFDLGAIHSQPVFHWIAKAGKVEQGEMLRTFNCGIGFVVIVAPHDATAIVECFHAHGEKAFPIGAVERRGAGEPLVRYAGVLGACQ